MIADLRTLQFPKKHGDLTKNLEISANGKLRLLWSPCWAYHANFFSRMHCNWIFTYFVDNLSIIVKQVIAGS